MTRRQSFRTKYGVGMVRPGNKRLVPFIAGGYLTECGSLDALAAHLGVDAKGQHTSMQHINHYATAGHKKPNLGPLPTAPYYAVKLYPGDIGAATSLATDADARVLYTHGSPMEGLYAVGNDMQSNMGGVYTAPGITIGPCLVFASLVARHAAARCAA